MTAPMHAAARIISHQERIDRLRDEIRVKLDQIEILKAEQQQEPTAASEIIAVLMRDKP